MSQAAPSDPTPRVAVVVGYNTLAIMLALLAMMGPFAIDTYLPAFPNIQASLHANALEVQQTLTVYMLSFAMMILWHGALSDSFGRRNIILGSLALFAIASLGCASAHSVTYLWAFRMLQGMSAGAGVVIGRAIIRDLYADSAATRLLSLVTMIFSIAPAIAPILGGWIVKLLDWRSIFLFLFLYTSLLLWFCYKHLPETLPAARRQPFYPRVLAHSYKKVFRSPLFHLKAGAVAFNFGGLFLYVAAAPTFLTEQLHLGPDQFGWQFIPSVAGIFFGALTANRLAGKMPMLLQILIGFGFLVGASVVNVVYHVFLPPAIPWSVAPLFFYCFGMSVVAPGATLMVLDLFPAIRGIVASCQSFTLTMFGALISGVLAPLLSHSALALACGQLACAVLGLGFWLASRSYSAMQERRAPNAWEAVSQSPE
ncbi:MAG: multidrug effflux MFS transporter [Herminiimonas sp.]|nr:multidrug effflux MFS transporter [Herminiimonas sp.]